MEIQRVYDENLFVAPNGRVRRLTRDGASYDLDFTPDGGRIMFSSGSTVFPVSATGIAYLAVRLWGDSDAGVVASPCR